MRKTVCIIPAVIVALVFLFPCSAAYAAIPLITEDTGTQGKGRFQSELFGKYGKERGGGIRTDTTDISVTLTYGLVNDLDLIFAVPYSSVRTEGLGILTKNDGLSDLQFDAKWRFFEKGNWSFALKPGITIPTGDDTKGLGAGRATYHLLFVTTYNRGEERYAPEGRRIESPDEKAAHHIEWSVHFNAGYTLNENSVDERKDLWFFSAAGSIEFIEDLYIVADLGIQTNTDKTSHMFPAYALAGFSYSPAKNFDIGLGLKLGLNHAEPDYSIRGGITVRF